MLSRFVRGHSVHLTMNRRLGAAIVKEKDRDEKSERERECDMDAKHHPNLLSKTRCDALTSFHFKCGLLNAVSQSLYVQVNLADCDADDTSATKELIRIQFDQSKVENVCFLYETSILDWLILLILLILLI